jgi:hypothetical protein
MWGGIQVLTLWIDGRKAFCFSQVSNPGPSALSECPGGPFHHRMWPY